MNRLLAATAFLTRIPIRRRLDAKDVGKAALLFPLVGAGLGLAQFGLSRLAGLRFGAEGLAMGSVWMPPLLLAVLLVAFSTWMTRGLHLDGLADMVDGLGGGRDRDSVLRIMRDSRVGAFGAMALVLVLAAKIAAIQALLLQSGAEVLAGLVLAPMLARWACVAQGWALPYARTDGGMGAAITDHVGWRELSGATLFAAGLVAYLAPAPGVTAWAAVGLVTLWIARLSMRVIGGLTGDVLGANVELSETAALIAVIAVASL